MKTGYYFKLLAFAAAAALSAACSSDDTDDKPAPGPEFPELRTLEIAAGQTEELSFHADADWRLLTNRSWVRFVDETGETPMLMGKAGDVTCLLRVSDAGLGFEPGAARIDLRMGSETRPLCKITRPGIEPEAYMWITGGFNKPPLRQESADFKVTSGKTNFSVTALRVNFTANFDWTVEVPDGFTIVGQKGSSDLFGAAAGSDEELREPGPEFQTFPITLNVAPRLLGFSREGMLAVRAVEGNQRVEIPISYPGMGDEDAKFETSASSAVQFSTDGHLMGRTADGMGPTEETSYENFIAVRDQQYEPVTVIVEEKQPKIAECPWLKIDDKKDGNFSISVAENVENGKVGLPRDAYVFFLPVALAADKEAAVKSFFNATSGTLTNRKCGIQIKQDGEIPVEGFELQWGNMTAVAGVVPVEERHPGFFPAEGYDMLPENNTYAVTLSDDVIGTNSILKITPVGYVWPAYPVMFTDVTAVVEYGQDGDIDWNKDCPATKSDTYRLTTMTNLKGKHGKAFVLFYKTKEDKENNGKALAALLIEKE